MDQNQNPYQDQNTYQDQNPYRNQSPYQTQNPYQPQNGQYDYQGGQNQAYQQNGQQGGGSPYQTQQPSVSFELPQQSPYEQYYSAPAKKKLNPLVIVIPAAGIIIAALIIALIIVLNGSDNKNNISTNNGHVGGNNSGGIGHVVSDDNSGNDESDDGNGSVESDEGNRGVESDGGDDGVEGDDGNKDGYGVGYDPSGNPVYTEQTLNNSSLKEYNSRNPFDISINIYAAGDANKLAAVETADKKKIQQLIISEFDISYDSSVDIIVGEPFKITYKQPELLNQCEVVYNMPDSLINGSAHFPDSFDGIERFAVFYYYEDYGFDDGDILGSSDSSLTVNGYDGGWYFILIDMDAMIYGRGLDPSYFGYNYGNEDEDEGSTEGVTVTTSTGTENDPDSGGSGSQGQDVFTHSTHTSDGKFICEYIGIGANLGSSWIFDTDDEIADQNGIMEASDEALRKRLESGNVVYDMHAVSDDTFSYVSLIYTPMYTTLDDYVDIHMEKWTETMKSIYDDVTVTRENVRFAGLTAIRLYSECNTEYSSTYDYSYYIDCGDCIANVGIFAFEKEELDSIAASFYAL